MKTKNILIILTILCLFFTTSTALAQTEDPPPKKHEEPPIETQQAEPVQTEPQNPTTPSPDFMPPPPDKYIDESTSRSSSNREVSEVDSFDIGVVSGITERNSDVASHNGVYAVAYEKNGEIIVAYIIGDMIVRYTLSNGLGRSYYPAIAYNAAWGLFITTWQYDYAGNGSDYDVRVRASTSTGAIGDDDIWVASSEYHETNPDIACNPYDGSCLITYEYKVQGYSTTNIHGRYMDTTVSVNPDNFELTSLNAVGPHVAWSDYGSSYLVAYTWTSSGGEAFPVYTVLYDTWQGSASASKIKASAYGVDTGWYDDNGHDKYATGVAYDFCSEKFIIVYTYDYYGNGTDYDVHASATNSNGNTLYGPFYIATTSGQESDADISFITEPTPSIANAASCKLVTTYIRSEYYDENGIMTTDIEGNCSYNAPDYTTDWGGDHLLIDEPSISFGSGVFAPAISGGNGSDFFVSYDYVTGGMVYQYSVLGKLLSTETNKADLSNYLPLIIR